MHDSRWAYATLVALLLLLNFPRVAQDAPTVDPAGLTADEVELVSVDWFEEILEGGTTMVALGLVSVALLAFIVERALRMRTSNVVPDGLIEELLPLFKKEHYDRIRELCAKRPSAIAHIATFFVDHREADPQLLLASAGDLGAREIDRQERQCQPFAVIAGIAPLLGLLGTMIGMIESFKLVEVFGDEGGASLLAGSISKALITTAVGLILAIPALIAYHGFKHRAQNIGTQLEVATERLFNAWFLTNRSASRTAAPTVKPEERPGTADAAPVKPQPHVQAEPQPQTQE